MNVTHFRFPLGANGPDPKGDVKIPANGVTLPLGKITKTNDVRNFGLNYNEYVVYNSDQVVLRYIVKFK